MEYSSFWGSNAEMNIEGEYTHNILKIMDAQCEYLSCLTHKKVSAVFGEIKQEGAIKNISNLLRNSMNEISYDYETIGDRPIDGLIDANSIYSEKKYGFEIYTEEYRFRLFELRMNPIYPVTIKIDEGICQSITEQVKNISLIQLNNNSYQIENETEFCEILKMILQNKKVAYIVNELQKRVKKNEKEEFSNKVIICEGKTDEVFLQALAQKLGCDINIAVADGKDNVPIVFSRISKNRLNTQILIMVDSDGEYEDTKEKIETAIGSKGYELAIVNDCLEDWLDSELNGFSKLKLIQSMGDIVGKINLDEYINKYEGFAKIVSFMKQ